MPAKPTVVIIIPTYNEKGNVDALITHLQEKIFPKLSSNYQMHVLVVDDTSPDGTAEVVQLLTKKYKNVHLVINAKKMGLGKAYTVGMKYALKELGADILFEFDADFSHDPKKIPEMLKKIEEGYDLVLGSRYIKGGSIPENWGLHRKFLSVIGNLAIRIIITRFGIHDWTTGYRAITAPVAKTVLRELESDSFMGYTFQIGFLHKAVQHNFKIAEVPFQFKDRTLGKSKLGTEYIKNTLIYIFKVRIKDLLKWRLFKFAMVGGIGALIQLTTLSIYRSFLPFQLAVFLSIETSIVSNFIWSNLWTFADRKLTVATIPAKFLQFNLASSGSILIQQSTAFLGEKFIGIIPLFTIFRYSFDTGTMYVIIGIAIGMFWNFFAYSRLIWRKKNR